MRVLCLAITLDVISARVSDGLSRHRLRAGGPDGGRQGGGGSRQPAGCFALRSPFLLDIGQQGFKRGDINDSFLVTTILVN